MHKVLEKKRCSKCRRVRPIANFSRDKGRPDGFNWVCRDCNAAYRKDPKRVAVRHRRERSEEGKRAAWVRQVKYKYGLSKVQYEELLEKTPACEICGRPFGGKPHIDHCHETGRIRGLLCGSCNRAIGQLMESEEVLLSAIKYLRRARGKEKKRA